MIEAQTEGLIQDAFKRLTARHATFMIVHRLATIQHADSIYMENEGEIMETATIQSPSNNLTPAQTCRILYDQHQQANNLYLSVNPELLSAAVSSPSLRSP